MKTKTLTKLVGLSGLTAMFVATAASAQDITINLGHVSPVDNPYGWATEFFAERVAEYTDGAVEIALFPGAQLGGDRDLLEGIQLGSVDAGYISLAIWENISPALTGFSMPFLIDSYETAYEAQSSDVAARALATFEDANIKALAIVENGFRVPGNTVRPIRLPEDFEGIAFRAPEAPLLLGMFDRLGANVTPMPYPEIFTALQTGVLEGQDQYLNTWISQGAYEVVDYLSITQMYTWSAVIGINLQVWEQLSPEQQEALERAAAETQLHNYELMAQTDAEALAVLEEYGLQIEQDIDLAPFEEVLAPLYEEYAAMDPIIAETIALIQSIRAE